MSKFLTGTIEDDHDYLCRILRRYYPFIWDVARDDFSQEVWVGCLMGSTRQERNRIARQRVERLARNLGFRRICEDGRRVWVSELKHIIRGKRPGAPLGNNNRKKKALVAQR